MPLTLTVTSYKGAPPSTPASVSIDHESLTIGRHKGNSLVLHDPENFVSGTHAQIEYRDDGYYITDNSTNHTLIDQTGEKESETKMLKGGQSAKLNNNDLLTIGDYEIRVSVTPQHDHARADDLSYGDDFENSKFPLENDNRLDSLPDDPFADILTPTAEHEGPRDQEAHNDNTSEDFSFLDFIDGPDRKSAEQARPQPDTTDIFADLEPMQEDTNNSTSPAAEKSAQPPPPISNIEVGSEHVINFLKGAGIENSQISGSIDASTFYLIGQLLSRSLQGAIQVLWARSKIKGELGLEVTIVHGRGNNPLKFSPSAQESLIKMLGPHGEAYMPATEAIDEAFSDIGAHEMAVMAGMRSALNDVLKRFNPEYLEQRLQQKNPISVKLPIYKKAMLWDLFQDLYGEIEKEAQDDFNHLFGRAFAKAYDAQLRKTKK